ncbi:inositol monophosphatase family protein [Pseudooceanicola sp.]|uniref:inositol monophosphatase family protein n=1 Tax=Pseudooceanicola sp. TaxID=1914328 RepID=UPI0026240F0F|nr:inositol monophosphatase family protein [Pseudooceanicola sp.]MDF1855232.1 inositol monophosphatase family protein [Pseudooceanicola sp.]
MMTSQENRDIISTANALADAARAVILPHFRAFGGLIADNKETESFDPVTVADRESERKMREILAECRPDDAILGEEFGSKPGTSGLTWVLDPIDGTRGFLSGTPTWGVLIAVGGANGPDFGIIDQPYTGERFWGGYGQSGMTGPLGERALGTRSTRALEDAILFSTFPEIGSCREQAAFRAVADRVKLTRYGMDCYAYALLAAGQIDLVIEAGLYPYDVQAPIAVIQAAGGIVTDWAGGPAHMGGRILAAGNADIHRAALDQLRPIIAAP